MGYGWRVRQDDVLPVAAVWRVFAVCFVVCFLLRAPALFRSVLDWDESLYVVMAQAWLGGHLPYTTVWDNKPVGIYAIFSLFIGVFGKPVLAIRLATVVFAAATATGLWRLGRVILPGGRLGGLAAAVFVVASLCNDGLSANTELFMETFSIFAVLAAVAPGFCARRPGARGFCVGLLFGLACMTKYVAVFEAPAIGFALLFFGGEAAGRGAGWRKVCGAVVGGAMVPALTIGAYAWAGQLGLWWQCAIASNVVRVAVGIPPGRLYRVATVILPPWLPCVLGVAVILGSAPIAVARALRARRAGPAARAQALLVLWAGGAAVGVASAKLFYDHYFLQILPVSCLCLAWAVGWIWPGFGGWSRWRAALVFGAALWIPAVAGGGVLDSVTRPLIAPGVMFRPDGPARAAAALRPAIAGGASLYIFDGQPIIYALTGAIPPTRFVLPSVLTQCVLSRVAGIDPLAELGRILAQNPRFILRAVYPPGDRIDEAAYATLTSDLTARYTPWWGDSETLIYRLRDNAPPYNSGKMEASCGRS